MQSFVRISLLILFVIVVQAQDFGRLQAPGSEKEKDEIQSIEAMQPVLALERTVDPDTYNLGPGDELGLNIITAENITISLIISPTGDLLIPSVGVVHVGDLTVTTAIKVINTFIHNEAYPTAKVNLMLLNLRSFKIQIAGAVNEPGFVVVNSLERLSDVIELSGGFHQLAREFSVSITRNNGEVQLVNYLNYLRNGALADNPVFREGDIIHVPFGSMDKEGIVLRGAVMGSGYDIIEPDEQLGYFLQRRVKFNQNADLESVVVTKRVNGDNVYTNIEPEDFFSTNLNAGETIDILWEKGVMVNGFVLTPGGFDFFPGYTAADYISMAGGNSVKGNPDRCSVRHTDGTEEYGQATEIRRGDVIVIPRTLKDSIIGETSVLQILVSVMTIYLTFIATGGN